MEELDIDKEFDTLRQDEIKIDVEIAKVDKLISFYIKFAWTLIGVGFLIGLLGVIEHFLGSDMQLNVIGDYTGGVVASTWSLAGLFIIYVAFLGQKQQILHQKMELKYNQFEVKATRKELEGQKEQMIEQNKTLKQQRFETTFFQMVNLHHKIVDSIDILTNKEIKKGRDCFKLIYSNILIDMTRGEKSIVRSLYAFYANYKEYESDLSHYFRNLYTISKFIHQSKTDDKQIYADILRAQLSSYELLLLFYNCLSDFGNEKFKPLVEEYQLLKNIPQKELIDIGHKNEYKSSAFGEGLK